MNWSEFLSRKLSGLGAQELNLLLQDVSRNILFGYSHLRSKMEVLYKKQEPRIYDAYGLVDLWRDVYGANWMWDNKGHPQNTVSEGLKIELRGITLHEYLSTMPGYRYAIPNVEYRQKAVEYFPQSYHNVTEEMESLRWGATHKDIGILDVRYDTLDVNGERHYLLGATAGEVEGSPSSFPVLVNEQVYFQIAKPLKLQGAVKVEKLLGEIAVGDNLLKLPFKREFQRDPLVLYADKKQKVVTMDNPHLVLGDAWTMAKIDGDLRTLSFTFELGKDGWESRLGEKCWMVTEFCKKHGGVPLIDFDAKRIRFPDAKVYPKTIEGWYDEAINSLLQSDQKGNLKMGDTYNIQQAGAVGPNSQAYNVTFTQIVQRLEGTIDLVRLVDELSKLRLAMKKEATEAEHDVAISNVAQAEQAAKNKDVSKVVEYLRYAGKWALDIAVQIGVPLAIEVIKQSVEFK